MFDDEEWKHHTTTDDGVRLDINGYDEKGHYYGTYRYRGSGSNTSSTESAVDHGFYAAIAVLTLLYIILKKFVDFVKNNWISFAIILGIIVVSAIACKIVHHKAGKPKLKIALILIVASLLISGVYNFGMERNDGNFANFSLKHIFKRDVSPATDPKTIYAYINIDQLNFRAGPSVSHDIIMEIPKDTRVEVLDNSELWWKIKYENTEGYVNSEYLRKE